MAKTNISMPDGMLDDVDRRASAAGTTRSGFIQEAISHYGAQLDAAKAARERSERIGRAMDSAREVARRVPPGTDGTSIIRAMRDAPPSRLDRSDEDDE